MKTRTFLGGVHPFYGKEATKGKTPVRAEVPKQVVIPLHQHIGAPCEPLVAKGDEVKLGQKIGDTNAFVSAPVHSSVSGKVLDIKEMPHPNGGVVLSAIIENDGQDTLHEDIKPKGKLEDLTPDELRKIMRESGLVGMGGAAFPTHVKYAPPKDKKIEYIILNGAECEPYLTADHQVMLTQSENIVYGLKAMMKTVGVNKAIIGIEDNKPDAIEKMREAIKGEDGISIVELDEKYPQGAEKQLIKACIDREVPPGGLPMDVGVIVNNTGTAAALAQAIKTGMPLIERVVTVTGSGIAEPKNLIIRVGTIYDDVIAQCGGFKGEIGKVIMGGPMMGLAQMTTEVPVTKGTSGILILTKEDTPVYEELPCVKCAKCVDACPVYLLPLFISLYGRKDKIDKAEELNALDCIECGSCSFICPSRRNLLQGIRYAKNEIWARRKKAQQG